MKRFRPGVTFGDFVIQDWSKRPSRLKDETTRDFRRGWLVWMMVMLGFGVLMVRMADLQIFRGERYRVLADENRVKQIKLPSPRGRIMDRNGNELATNVETRSVINGVDVTGYKRQYVTEAAAHVSGYLGEIKEDEVGLLKEKGGEYGVGDWIGRSGLEYEYEKELRGMDGGKLVEVDYEGKPIRELGKQDPLPGQDLKTSLDKGLLQTALEGMGRKKGAVVASDPRNGEILAIVSSPSYDANLLVMAENNEKVNNILTDSNLPLFNRAIGGVYPPGSTFKMITTAAAIESGKVKRDFTYNDMGLIEVNGYKYTNWLFTKRGRTEGVVGFTRAIARSTDTFFYKVGELTSPEVIVDWAKKFGLSKNTGIDIPGEVEGLVPEIGNNWFLGNTFHLAIGQSDLLTTPVQINTMTGILATGGRKCVPHMNQRFKISCSSLNMLQETLEIIRRGMVGACSSEGTAYPLFSWNEAAISGKSKGEYELSFQDKPLPVVACKTGTAEYVAENGKIRTHGWLTAYAPADNPQIAVTVVIEGGGEGSDVAAPVVRKMLAKFFEVEDKYPYGSIRNDDGE